MRVPSPQELRDKQRLQLLWEEDRCRLLLRHPFLAHLAMHVELRVVLDDRCRTACTDGQRIFGDARYLATCSAEHRLFVLLHEVWHAALRHCLRAGSRQGLLWNVAVDHEVHDLLQACGWTLPPGAVYFPHWRGRNAEQVYDSLQDQLHQPQWQGPGQHVGLETDDLEVVPGGLVDPDFTIHIDPPSLAHWPQTVQAVTQQLASGSVLSRRLGDLVQRDRQRPRDWRRVLVAALQEHGGQGGANWQRPNRRHCHAGRYLPSSTQPHLRATIALDTSASTQAVLPRFFAVLQELLASYRRWQVEVLVCDEQLQQRWLWQDRLPAGVADLQLRGGRGTDFRPVFRHCQQRPPPLLCYLTDGLGRVPEQRPSFPVLWLLAGTGPRRLPWGQSLRLDQQPPSPSPIGVR